MNTRRYLLFITYFFCLFALLACDEASTTDEDEKEEEIDDYEPKTPVTQSRSEKRGVSFAFQFTDDVKLLGKGASWSYNWGPDQTASFDAVIGETNMDFCPMAWNGIDANRLRAYKTRHPECKYLLAFNEPNLTDQANMTPRQAADRWPAVKSIADELGLEIISPAMNYGTLSGYGDPITWLDEFFQLIPISDISGISIHSYMPDGGATKSYIERFRKYNKPVWLTEFCAWDGVNAGNFKLEGQMNYMVDIINYMESDPNVFRYAWFIPRGGNKVEDFPYMYLLTKSSKVELTPLGKVFVNMSSQDKNTYYVEEQIIEAEHYSSVCIAESVGKSGWTNGPFIRPTTDAGDETLELYGFVTNEWVEYQVEIDRNKALDLEVRYASLNDSELDVMIDGVSETTLTLTSTGQTSIWATANTKIHPAPGKHTLRLKINKGNICMNWLKIGIKH
ncbi:hypothetical protein EZS27_008031 [termite gut metagenome]|uniref:CBM6 domain-containing protein n=1 Tax=termite gut metagenome TaxID=433724 RepID=A0A5J4SG28_9ZZZZ